MCSKTLLSPHISTLEHCRTRNPLACVPLPHPTVTGPPSVPYLYLQHSPASHSYSTAGRSCSHVTSVPNVLVWSQEEEAIFSAPGGMSEVRLWCRCCLVPGCWCWAGAWVTVSQMETKKRNICAVSGPRPPLTRVKIFSVHPVKIFSVHCVRPAAMCLVQNMCNNLAHVTTISKHSAQKTAYIEPQQHTYIAWFDIHIRSTHTIKSTDVRCYHFHLSRSLIILVRYKKLEKTWTSVFCIHYFDYV